MKLRPLHISIYRAIELLHMGVGRQMALRIANRLEKEGNDYKDLARRIRQGRYKQVGR